jgi:hypothetical protein
LVLKTQCENKYIIIGAKKTDNMSDVAEQRRPNERAVTPWIGVAGRNSLERESGG